VWIEIPDDDLVALRTDFVVARVVTEEERRKGGNVIWGWEARDIVNLLDAKGNITDTLLTRPTVTQKRANKWLSLRARAQ
jgi:hypothetical protein